MNNMPQTDLPQHIAVIMDGNGRWAQMRGLMRTAGHRAGLTALRRVVEGCVELKIPALTVFAFSSENWLRPRQEVQFLLALFSRTLQREIQRLCDENIRIRVIGDINRFSPRLQALIQNAEELTKNNTGLQFTVAANYGGRWDIMQAAKKIAASVESGELTVDNINEERLNHALCLADLPPPDFLIRTSGEKRISNFLMWQLAYAELYFTDTYWPDFDKSALISAINEFTTRQRRFGLTGAQVLPTQKQVQGA